MKLIFASDSFKGSLSSGRTGELLKEAAERIFPGCETYAVRMADGGEGTADAVLEAAGGTKRTVRVRGPLGIMTEAQYAVLPDGSALIEMAEASGLALVPPEKRDALHAGSWGTGELICHALKSGIRKITVAIGGSATSDGGIGAMTALGVRFLDAEDRELSGCGADLAEIKAIDCAGLMPEVWKTRFTVMCDVDNPLLGSDGAVQTYGPQKGAGAEAVKRLEQGMERYAACLEKQFGAGITDFPGAGAAGGIAAAFRAFLGAEMRPGTETLLELVGFDRLLEGADLVVTGEGRTDLQSVRGKTVNGVAEHGKRMQVPVAVLSGGIGEGAEELYERGVSVFLSLVPGPMTSEEAMDRAEELYLKAAERMFRMMKIGAELQKKR